MARLAVRGATPADADALAAVLEVVAPEGFLGVESPVDVQVRAERFRETLAEDGPAGLWVLEDGSAVLGYAGVYSRIPGVLSLAMAIVPDGRGRGGGRALLEAVREHARAVGAHKLDLEAWVDNARAIAFYAAAGFEVEGMRRDHYRRRDGSLRSTLIMGMRLS